jgi:hypothetical protein
MNEIVFMTLEEIDRELKEVTEQEQSAYKPVQESQAAHKSAVDKWMPLYQRKIQLEMKRKMFLEMQGG